MSSFDINHNYEEHLRAAKPINLPAKTIHPPPGSLGAIRTIPPITIPPLNTDIRFSEVLPSFDIRKHPGLSAIDTTTLPEEFSWGIIKNTDSEKIKNKKHLITKPQNQMLCGSCWAISIAGVVSDNFVVTEVTKYNPEISTTYALSTYPQGKCQGGNPAQLLTDISKNGIASDRCVDYSWCAEYKGCNAGAEGHFQADAKTLSNLIPDGKSCYFPTDEHLLYKINPPEVSSVNSDSDIEAHVNNVKKHIYTRGSVSAGFIVLNNFMSGAFTHVNGGVYLENCDYNNMRNGVFTFNDSIVSKENYMGCHAIAIIGWGIEKGVVVDNKGTKKDVPYWHCRNSWTSKWGDNGYFKMAMYPYNKVVQFDRLVSISGAGGIGGIAMFNVTNGPVKGNFQKIEPTGELEKEPEFYKSEPKPVKNISGDSSDGNFVGNNKLKYLIFILIIIMLVFIGYKIYRRKN